MAGNECDSPCPLSIFQTYLQLPSISIPQILGIQVIVSQALPSRSSQFYNHFSIHTTTLTVLPLFSQALFESLPRTIQKSAHNKSSLHPSISPSLHPSISPFIHPFIHLSIHHPSPPHPQDSKILLALHAQNSIIIITSLTLIISIFISTHQPYLTLPYRT